MSLNSEQTGNTLALKKKKKKSRDFPGGPVVKILPSNAGGAGLLPLPGQGAKTPHATGPKKPNSSNSVTNSIKSKKNDKI